MISLFNKYKLFILLIIFAVSRYFIYQNPPLYYSDVTADYERYANMWRYGLTPYREHLYEYPPATIPLLSIPLDLDQQGIGKYYPNYRFGVLIIDVIFFVFLLATMIKKLPWMKDRWFVSALVYIGLTALAHDFYYEGIDVAFTAATLSAFLIPLWLRKPDSLFGQSITWLLFWLSTAIKFLTLPLVVPLFLLMSGNFFKKTVACFIGFFLTWGIAVLLYGSSLSVSFVFNNARPIKYASFPAYIIQVANAFTHSETQINLAPDFPYSGPVSAQITSLNKIIFPLSILVVLGWAAVSIFNKLNKDKKWSIKNIYTSIFIDTPALSQIDRLKLLLKIYGIYVFTLFLTAKTFSQPFHFWYLSLLAIYPFSSKKILYLSWGLALLMVMLDTTPYLALSGLGNVFGFFPVSLIRDAFRFIPMMAMLVLFLKYSDLLTEKSRGK